MKLNAKLYPYQESGRNFAIRAQYSICAFDMGLGKTVVALSLATKLNLRTLVVCPAFLVPNWISEIRKFVDEPNMFKVVSYSSLKKVEHIFHNYDYVICDEIHYAKNLDAKRTQLLHNLVEKNRTRYFLGLSGTPIKNRIPEFYSLLKLCHYGRLYPQFDKFKGSSWVFNMSFCNQRKIEVGGRVITQWTGMRNMPILRKLIEPVYNRRKDDGSLNLPDQIFHDVSMLNKNQNDRELEEAWDNYQGGRDRKNFSSSKAVNALSKTNFTAEFVTDKLPEAEKFVIFSDHVQAAKDIHAKLIASGVTAAVVTGETPVETRQELVDTLNAGGLQVLVATFGSLSIGVNLTGVNHMVLNDYPWSFADISQALKRTHRIGQKKTCHYYYIFSGRVDRKILRTLETKEKLLGAIDAKD